MGPIDSGRDRDVGGEDDLIASAIQLRLALSVVNRLIERNGGCAAGFLDDASLDTEVDQDEYLDPELWDPDADPVPDMADEIAENIFECL